MGLKRISFNVLGQYLTSAQKLDYLDFMRIHRPVTAVIMDDDDLVNRVLVATEGETMVIHRRYRVDDWKLWRYTDPKVYIREITQNYTVSRIPLLYLLNEPDTRKPDLPHLLSWLIAATNHAIEHGYRCVVGNIGPGTVEPKTIESGVFRDYLTWGATWSAAGKAWLGWHEYTSLMLPFGIGQWTIDDLADLDKMRDWLNWPKLDQDKMFAMRIQALAAQAMVVSYPPWWHLNRWEWFNMWAVENGIPRHQCIMTEGPWDRMGDLAQQMPENIFQKLERLYGAVGWNELRGPRTYENYWKAIFPDKTWDEVGYLQLHWLDNMYHPDMLCLNMFCIAFDAHMVEKTERWQALGYNFGDRVELQGYLLDPPLWPVPTPPDPEPMPEPDPPPAPTYDDDPPIPVWFPILVAIMVVLMYYGLPLIGKLFGG